MTNKSRFICAITGIVLATAMVGCGSGDDNRQPTPAEVKAADTKRQDFINTLNVPEDQKAQMRAHMGGPAANNAAADAASGQGGPPPAADGRRR